jgi:hypothetical protein
MSELKMCECGEPTYSSKCSLCASYDTLGMSVAHEGPIAEVRISKGPFTNVPVVRWEDGAVERLADGSKLYTSPQTTPELVQAARQALEALNREVDPTGYWPAAIKTMRKEAITALQNALEGRCDLSSIHLTPS